MAKLKYDVSWQGMDAVKHQGVNMLAGITPTVLDENGETPRLKTSKGKEDPNAILEVTLPYEPSRHIDIFGYNNTVEYDLGEVKHVDTIFISGTSESGNRYILSEYQLFASKEKTDNLFSEENLIYHINNDDLLEKYFPNPYVTASEAFFHCEDLDIRYFGVKFIRPCPTDTIARTSCIALFNTVESDSTFFLDRNLDVDSKVKYTSDDVDTSIVANNKVFIKEDAIAINGDIVLEPEKNVQYIALVGNIGGVEIFASDSKDDVFSSPIEFNTASIETGYDEECITYKFENSKKYLGLRFNGESLIEQIALFNYLVEAEIETENVRTYDFIGIGANDIPMAHMPESRHHGFRDIYWPVYRLRYGRANPAVVRVWFQVDWVVDNEPDYKIGKCNFQSDKWKDFIKYMDMYEENGIEVELNFGWKVSTKIQKWFSIPETGVGEWSGMGRAASAPRDFDGFAKTCCTVAKELADKYTCFKYLTFYNESGYGDLRPHDGDFLGYMGQSKEKWLEMILKVNDELIKANLDKRIKYFVPEISGPDDMIMDWFQYMNDKIPELIYMNPFHRYAMYHDTRMEWFKRVQTSSNGGPISVGEFGVFDQQTWMQSQIEYVMSVMESGLHGALFWIMQGVMMTDPNFLGLGCHKDRRAAMLLQPYIDGYFPVDGLAFKEFSLFTNYIPRHSMILESKVLDNGIRVETVKTADGDYTVFVETKEVMQDKKIRIKFDKKIGKRFHKHIYREKYEVRDGNCIVPPVVEYIDVDDEICDNLGNEYGLFVYTTLPATKQIKLDTVETFIENNETFKFNATTIDCEGEIEWSVEYTEAPESTISADGVFTPNPLASKGDKYLIKASLKGDGKVKALAMVNIK